MDYYIVVIVFLFGAGFVNLLVCEASLLYFINKYDVSNESIKDFLNHLSFPFTIVFRENPIFSIREGKTLSDFFIVGDRKESRFQRLIWGFISLLWPTVAFIGYFTSTTPIKKFLGVFMIIISLFMFILSWRFGHSLKLKAQT